MLIKPSFLIAALTCVAGYAHADTRTVEWFISHPNELAKTISMCRNNPGAAKFVPNCTNASTAGDRDYIRRFIAGVDARQPQEIRALCADLPRGVSLSSCNR